MLAKNKTYFISDTHLGIPSHESSLEREKALVSLLLEMSKDAKAIYLLGDIFDFWYEYKYVVPKGFTRLLGTLAHLCDKSIEVHFFTGNHDQWVKDYFQTEIGMIVHIKELETEIDGKRFYIAHGDGFDQTDRRYKVLKSIFGNKTLRVLFSAIHPYWAFRLAQNWSKRSRLSHGDTDKIDLGDKEPMIAYCKEILQTRHIDYFILGHRHLMTQKKLSPTSHYYNLGEWVNHKYYGVWDSERFEIRSL